MLGLQFTGPHLSITHDRDGASGNRGRLKKMLYPCGLTLKIRLCLPLSHDERLRAHKSEAPDCAACSGFGQQALGSISGS